MKKKLLLIGDSGFVGRHLKKALLKKNYLLSFYNSKNFDLTKKNKIMKVKESFDLIFFLATKIEVGKSDRNQNQYFFNYNQKIHKNFIDWLKKYNLKSKVITFGTSASYPVNLEMNEENYLKKKPQKDWSGYAYSKRSLHKMLVSLQKKTDLKYLTIVPSTIYGTDYPLEKKKKHFIIDLIVKILRGKYDNQKVKLFGDGNQSRDIIDIKDFIKLLLKVAFKIDNQIINISSGKSYTIKQYAKKLTKIIGYDFKNIYFDKKLNYGTKKKSIEIKKIKSYCKGYNFLDLEYSLKKTIKWCKKNLK